MDVTMSSTALCSVCEASFELRFAFQQVALGPRLLRVCSMPCRAAALQQVQRVKPAPPVMRLAVLNQKGGTGKTTTAVSVAAGLAEAGHETLLLDLDAQGHVASSLGAKTNHGLHDLMVSDWPARQCTVQLRKHLHAIIGDQKLVAVELWLARLGDGCERLLSKKLEGFDEQFRFVVLDCGPAQSLLNLNALIYARNVLVPVSCDYLSLLGVKQMLRTLEQIRKSHAAQVEVVGIVPTFYDRRNRMSDEAVKTLRGYFRDKVFAPIRINTTLKEAPQQQKSIFEYAPSSAGALDYRRLVEQLVELSGHAASGSSSAAESSLAPLGLD